MDTRRVETK